MLFIDTGGPSMVPDIKMAFKRAEHFTRDLSIQEPFTPPGQTGISIPIRNGLWFMDLADEYDLSESKFITDLLCLHWMAKCINNWIDNHLMDNDEEGKLALAAWLIRAKEFANWLLLD